MTAPETLEVIRIRLAHPKSVIHRKALIEFLAISKEKSQSS